MSASSLPPPSVARRRALFGALLVVASAVAFSAKAVIAKLMYRAGADTISVLALRMGFSLPIYLASAARTRRGHGPLAGRDLAAIAVLGGVGYYGSTLGDFWGLRFVSAGLERLTLFTYPTLVTLMSALVLKERVRAHQALALALTYIGIAVAFHAELSASNEDVWLGGALVFGSALLYAGYLVGSTPYIRRLGSERFTALALSVAALSVLGHAALARPPLLGYPARVYVFGGVMALVATVFPTFALAEGIRRIGPGAAAILGTTGPASTLLLAHWVLAEPLGAPQIAGTVLVLAGATLVAWRSR